MAQLVDLIVWCATVLGLVMVACIGLSLSHDHRGPRTRGPHLHRDATPPETRAP